MLTYDEKGGYPHPDHVMTHEVSVAAFEAAADPDAYPDSGDPWQPLKLYYLVSSTGPSSWPCTRRCSAAAWSRRTPRSSRNGPTGQGARRRLARAEITTRVPCGDYFTVRDQALLAHATQIDPDGFWFRCPLEVQQAVWPTEDYHLARSVVDSELPEDDLFAGVRERVCL